MFAKGENLSFRKFPNSLQIAEVTDTVLLYSDEKVSPVKSGAFWETADFTLDYSFNGSSQNEYRDPHIEQNVSTLTITSTKKLPLTVEVQSESSDQVVTKSVSRDLSSKSLDSMVEES